MEDALADSMKDIHLDSVEYRQISDLRDQGLDISYAPQQPCRHFAKRDVPIKSINTIMFDFWERQLNLFFGITLPKSTRRKWNQILYGKTTIHMSKDFKFLNRWHSGREAVKMAYMTTVLAWTGHQRVSGTLIVCEEEYFYDPLLVTITEHRSALWGLFNWEEQHIEMIPRNIDPKSIKSLQEIFRRDSIYHIYQIHRHLLTEKENHEKQKYLM